MYNVGDFVEYKQVYRGNEKGKILAKMKIIDSLDGNVGVNVYIILYDKRCINDLILETDIIKLLRR